MKKGESGLFIFKQKRQMHWDLPASGIFWSVSKLHVELYPNISRPATHDWTTFKAICCKVNLAATVALSS